MSEGWADVHSDRQDRPDAWGAVFFHGQDIDAAVLTGPVLGFAGWSSGCCGAAAPHRRARDPLSNLTVELAWRLLHVAPQFDTGRNPNDFGHSNHSGSISSADALAAAMVGVSKASPDRREAWSASPLFQTVLIPAAEDSGGDWHHGYMEAAAGHDGLDQPEVAWNLLCAGAFWINRRGGNWRAYFDAALALAERRGWTDCVAALRNMAERAGLD